MRLRAQYSEGQTLTPPAGTKQRVSALVLVDLFLLPSLPPLHPRIPMVSPYVPHAIYAMATLSISIHLVNCKKTVEEDRARVQSRESILRQIRDQLKVEGKGVNWEEVDRLKRLARPVQHDNDRFLPEVHLSWTDVFYGRKLPKEEDELSEWEKKDLEKLKNAFNEEKDRS